MFITLVLWLYLALTFEMCPLFWNVIEFSVHHKHFFFYSSFLVCFLFNYFILNLEWKEIFNKNADLALKFFTTLTTNFSIFINFFVVELKRFINFLLDFKYRKTILTLLLFLKDKISTKFNLWRPLFKKWSYFGYYRTNRSKWFK